MRVVGCELLVNEQTFQIATTEDGTSTANGAAVPQIFMSGWVKLRNPITKLWVNRWAILTPGTLIYYKSTSNMLRQRASGKCIT